MRSDFFFKNRFYVRRIHFEASQCPRVLGSAQEGERGPGAKARCGRDPGSRPMRRRIENALKYKNLQKSIKKSVLKLMRFYDVSWSPKLRLVMSSCTGSATVNVEPGHYIFSKLK